MTKKLTLPDLPLMGGCQCGAVRYKLCGPPVVFYICHCTECQKQSSGAFGQSLQVRRNDLKVEGKLHVWQRSSDSRNLVAGEFCPECGSRLFHRREGYQDRLNIKAGTLDDTSWLWPAGHIWTKSKQPWVDLSETMLDYPGQPENFDALTERWQQMTASN